MEARRQVRAAGRLAGAIAAENGAAGAAAAAAAADEVDEDVAVAPDVAGTVADAAVPADAARSARDAELEMFLRRYAELVADADEVLADLTTDGEELVQDNGDVTGMSTVEDDEWEQRSSKIQIQIQIQIQNILVTQVKPAVHASCGHERPGVALVVD